MTKHQDKGEKMNRKKHQKEYKGNHGCDVLDHLIDALKNKQAPQVQPAIPFKRSLMSGSSMRKK